MSAARFHERIHAREKFGLIAVILPFFISFSSTQTSTLNGVVTTYEEVDYFAILAGTAALLAIWTGIGKLMRQQDRPLHLVLIIAISLLGIYHILDGLGIFTRV